MSWGELPKDCYTALVSPREGQDGSLSAHRRALVQSFVERITRTLLVCTVLTFVPGLLAFLGVIQIEAIPSVHVLFPIGVILFGLFLISRTFGKETAAFDAEHHESERRLELRRVIWPARSRIRQG